MQIETIINVLQEVAKNAPRVYEEIKKFFHKDDPTAADWAELRARVADTTYEKYVPDSKLKPED